MPSPFPGMDPYLEAPAHWQGVHTNLIVAFQELLNRVIRPKYVARVEERVYMAAEDDPEFKSQRVPDVWVDDPPRPRPSGGRLTTGVAVVAEPVIVEPVIVTQNDPVRQRRIEIREVHTRKVVTVIELLSPSNKLKGAAGRKSFLAKRKEVMGSPANWVEIDLLRAGTPHPTKQRFRRYQYLAYSSPVAMRPTAKAWPIRLQDRLPVVGIPLRAPDPDAPLDLQAALDLAYDRAAYDATADYTTAPDPPLAPELATWADELLKQKKLR